MILQVVTGAGEYGIGRYTLSSDVLLTNNGQWGTLTLYVNGQQVDSVSDTTHTPGNVALFAWSSEQLNSTNVSFDDFIVTKVE